MPNLKIGNQASVAAAVALTIGGLWTPRAFSQTKLTGNKAVVAITARTTLGNFKATLKTLSDMGNRQVIDTVPSESNKIAVAWLVKELDTLGYRDVTIFGTYRSIYCTKVGTISPDSMYMICGHLDGVGGFGGALDDDGSGTALVLECARAFAGPAITTRCSIRFIMSNAHEGGYCGANEYSSKRRALQGKEDPPGSKQYPEPVWLGFINQDMILYDHGSPPGPVQIPGASTRIDYCTFSYTEGSLSIANQLIAIDKVISATYPAELATSLGAFDAIAFMNYCPTVSVEEGSGYLNNPYHHDDADVYATYSEADFALGFCATQREVATLASLTQATITGDTPAKSEFPAAHTAPSSPSLSFLARQHELTIAANSRGTHTVTLSSVDGTTIISRTGQGRMSYSLGTESIGAGLYVVTMNADGNTMQKTVLAAR
jgi:hypothetical protein